MRMLLLLCCCLPLLVQASSPEDSLLFTTKYSKTDEGIAFRPNQLVVPVALIGLGVYGAIDGAWDKDIRSQTRKWEGSTIADDVLVLMPGASIYVLDWCGIHSKHAFWDKTAIAATAAVLTIGSTMVLKECTSVQRPDGSNFRSFPSQHTAVAFAGAELLWQEYKHHSPWYGVAGYGIAACTGLLRIYNDKHWASDVLAGAGIGILSAKAAYWLYPSMRRLYSKPGGKSVSVLPYGSATSVGLSLSARF